MADRIFNAAQLTPQAQVVDTYSRPDVALPKKSGLADIANALKESEPTLQRFLASKQDSFIEDELAAAQQARMKNKVSYAEAVKLYETTGGQQGVSPGMSPWFVKEYKKMDGQLLARNEYMGYLHETYQKSGLAHQVYESPAEAAQAYSAFVEQQRGAFLTERGMLDDREWLEGFEAERGSIENSLAAQNLQERTKANEEYFNDSVSQYISSVIDSDASPEEKAAAIFADKEAKLGQLGMSGSKYNQLTVDSISNRAMDYARMGRYDEAQELLSVMGQVKTGTGTLGSTAYARNKTTEAELRIFNMQRQSEDYAWSRQSRSWALQDRELQRQALEYQAVQRDRSNREYNEKEEKEMEAADMMAQIFADPLADRQEEYSRLLREPHLAPLVPALQQFQDNRIDAKFKATEDPSVIAQLEVDILRGTADFTEVLDLVNNKEMNTGTAARLLNQWSQTQNNADRIGKLPQHQRTVVNDTVKGIESVIKGSDLAMSSEDERARALMAGSRAKRMMLEYLEANPAATELEAMDQAEKIKEKLLNDRSYSGDVIIGEGRTKLYVPQTETGLQFPEPPAAAIEDLRGNPAVYMEFDKKYGPGASVKYLTKE